MCCVILRRLQQTYKQRRANRITTWLHFRINLLRKANSHRSDLHGYLAIRQKEWPQTFHELWRSQAAQLLFGNNHRWLRGFHGDKSDLPSVCCGIWSGLSKQAYLVVGRVSDGIWVGLGNLHQLYRFHLSIGKLSSEIFIDRYDSFGLHLTIDATLRKWILVWQFFSFYGPAKSVG